MVLEEPGRQRSRDRRSPLRARDKNTGRQPALVFANVMPDPAQSAGEDHGLADAQQQPQRHKLPEDARARRRGTHQAPQKKRDRHGALYAEPVHQIARGNLQQRVAPEKRRVEKSAAGVCQMEPGFEIGCGQRDGQVGAVDVADNHAHAEQANQDPSQHASASIRAFAAQSKFSGAHGQRPLVPRAAPTCATGSAHLCHGQRPLVKDLPFG